MSKEDGILEMLKFINVHTISEMKTFLENSIKFCQGNLDKNRIQQLGYTSFSDKIQNLPETKTYYINLLKHQKDTMELLEMCKRHLENLEK